MSCGADADKKRIDIIGISCMVLLVIAIAVVVVLCHIYHGNYKSNGDPQISTSTKAIQLLCQSTEYKETCVNSLSSAAGNMSDVKELIKVGFQVDIDALKEAIMNSTTLTDFAKDSRTIHALKNCYDLLDSSVDDLKNSLNKMGTLDLSNLGHDDILDLKIWLSGAITFEESCLDEFENTTSDVGQNMKHILNTLRELTSNSLDMITQITPIVTSLNTKTTNSRLLLDKSDDSFPSWVDDGRRRLLQETPATIQPDVVVAKDGSGKYLTINEALDNVPIENNKTFVMYIKEGVYEEYVEVTKKVTNIMFIGDGPDKTKITGSKNFVDGINTINTATVAIMGANFMAKDIGFENTAGPIKHQAVALRVQADMSIFYNCLMDGYQDTFYAHAHSQFYRDCTITGTIDFIFGDAAAIFQNCKMVIKKPLQNQNCMVTAQGRTKENEATGLILQNCTITGEPAYLDVKDVNKAYLGRPWREYSRTIIMNSQIDDVIQPEGWIPWNASFAFETLWYAEYNNRGPGSVQTNRVRWTGIKNLTAENAVEFSVGNFISDSWIKPTGVYFVVYFICGIFCTKGDIRK